MAGEVKAGLEEMRAASTEVQVSLINTMTERLSGSKQDDSHLGCSSCHSRDNVQEEEQRFIATAAEVPEHIAELRPPVRSTGDQPLLDQTRAPLEARQQELLAAAGREAQGQAAASRPVTALLLCLFLLVGAVVCHGPGVG